MIKLKYTVRNSDKTKQTKNKRIHVTIQLHVVTCTMYVYTYEFRCGVVTDNQNISPTFRP